MKRTLFCIFLLLCLLATSICAAVISHPNTKSEDIASTKKPATTTNTTFTTEVTTAYTSTVTTTTVASVTTKSTTTAMSSTSTKKTTKATKQQTTFTVKDKVMNDVPLYDQTKYKHVPYGKYGTVSSHGCGIVCISMIASYLKDKEYTPEVLASQFGKYNTAQGSLWSLFEDAGKALDLDYKGMTYSKEEALKALANGQLVISAQKKSVFSEGGHFILLTGISEDGKIFVNDPYGPNYAKSDYMKNGYKNGFTQKDVCSSNSPYWIYGKKQ